MLDQVMFEPSSLTESQQNHLKNLFNDMRANVKGTTSLQLLGDSESDITAWISSHPATKERIARFIQ